MMTAIPLWKLAIYMLIAFGLPTLILLFPTAIFKAIDTLDFHLKKSYFGL